MINASDLVAFSSRYIPQDPEKDDYAFELKYLANLIECKHNNRNTSKFLQQRCSLKPNTRLLQVEIMTALKQFGIDSRVSLAIVNDLNLKKGRGQDLLLSDLSECIDAYRQQDFEVEQAKASGAPEGGGDDEQSKLLSSHRSLLKMALWLEFLRPSGVKKFAETFKNGLNYGDFFNTVVDNYKVLDNKDAIVFFKK
jgi:hypothetical protein